MSLSKSVRRLIFACVLALAADGFAQTNTDGFPQISASDATNYLGQQVVVVDKVVQVATRSNIWLLHLNQKFPKSPLNAVIRKAATNNFANIDGYLGQRVELTGRITEYRGRLELSLETTNQIKILSATPVPSKPVVAEAPIKAVVPETLKPATASPVAGVAIAPVPAAPAPENSGRALEWILGLLGVISLLLAVGIFMFWRRHTNDLSVARQSAALAKLPDNFVPDSASTEDWKQRALAAEAMAGKQGQMLRDKMIPELTEFAKQSLVQGLYAQRNVLIETQRKAHLALAELEARLNTLQAPLDERIRVYETRIAELEKEVETQGEEMRELARATLTLVRQKLEDERATERLHTRFN